MIKVRYKKIKLSDGSFLHGLETTRDNKPYTWEKFAPEFILSKRFRKAYLQRKLWLEKIFN